MVLVPERVHVGVSKCKLLVHEFDWHIIGCSDRFSVGQVPSECVSLVIPKGILVRALGLLKCIPVLVESVVGILVRGLTRAKLGLVHV